MAVSTLPTTCTRSKWPVPRSHGGVRRNVRIMLEWIADWKGIGDGRFECELGDKESRGMAMGVETQQWVT